MTSPPSWATTPATRLSMQANRSRDTAPEVAVRRLLHAHGLRYRVAYRALPGARCTVDVAFTRARLAVLIDGCWWHGCPTHYRAPTANSSYWSTKVARNMARDALTTEALRAAGWEVLRFWEHEDPAVVAAQVEAVVRGRRAITCH